MLKDLAQGCRGCRGCRAAMLAAPEEGAPDDASGLGG
jgi:hypothetical protein